MHYYFSYSSSKVESKRKGLYVTDKVNVRILGDSVNLIRESFDIWIDKCEITEQYGFLPIRYTYEDKNFKNLEIKFKDGLSEDFKNNILLKINNGDFVGNYSIPQITITPNDTVRIDFYKKFSKRKFSSAEIIFR